MKKRWFIILAAMIAFFTLVLRAPSALALKEADGNMEAEILQLENAYRAQYGLKPLDGNVRLSVAANVRAKECGTYFSHMRPDGTQWWSVAPDDAYGENLSAGITDADTLVRHWMDSAAHRSNILDPSFRSAGVSLVQVDNQWYCVQEFGF